MLSEEGRYYKSYNEFQSENLPLYLLQRLCHYAKQNIKMYISLSTASMDFRDLSIENHIS